MEAVDTWILPALVGLGLAAACGLKTFLPLLMLAAAARFQLFGVALNDSFAWLASTPALVALALATALELAADKIPVLDHALSAVGTVARPAAGVLAAGSLFAHLDPATAALAGVIVGAPTAFAFNAAQGTARVASTATTGGLANPLFSLVDDALSFLTAAVAIVLPLLVLPLLGVMLWLAWRVWRRANSR
ncbi:DUF4126 domain-containing protein [Caulobacter sp. 17J80-11]|uniref:DUF4126 domain-containing protein n=1 Tax=Caulobacter sp. 17J80-11 TaxID=2763502 RepID=UPI0016534FA2|nr:DUF4126 domain-containing protein [Caulobacter sp. 17J80-11]MBC6980452.1 DUF4126 domain-containing protein [Caulobacter sp. 17J80-11]